MSDYATKRTQCPKCGAKRGFAKLETRDDGSGFCHACGEPLWGDGGSSHYQPRHRTESKPAAVVRDGLIQETSAETSALHVALINIGGQAMASHLRQWNIGTDGEGWTLFHMIDAKGQHRTTKGIPYDRAGKRLEGARFGIKTLSGAYVNLSKDKGHRPCMFGEQWTQPGMAMIDHRGDKPRQCTYDATTPIVLVESEKTAVVASFMMPQWIWLASGGSTGITKEKASPLRDRVVLIMFDCDRAGRDAAAKAADVIAGIGGKPIHQIDGKPVQDHVFTAAADGYDFADYVMDMLASQAAQDKTRSTLRISEGVA
jgi:hypothetical protein